MISKILKRLFIDSTIALTCLMFINPITSHHGDMASAEDMSIYPYNKTFTISAYYSPLPCQNKYTTGSYEGDIRLNGSGVNGADGTPVYPGMIAAPSSYAFGTKMYIPSIGIVAVHDRGGAIVASNGQDGVYDRLDVWMGYGDKGLERALNWGKRTIEVTIYGLDDAVTEQIILDDYSPDENNINSCGSNSHTTTNSEEDIKTTATTVHHETVVKKPEPEPDPVKEESMVNLTPPLYDDLKHGDQGEEVTKLQTELFNLNYYKGEIHGIYDDVTEHAVFKFQQSQYLVGDENSPGAGVFGPKTRDRLNEIINLKNYSSQKIAEASSQVINKLSDTIASEEPDNYEAVLVAANSPESNFLITSELDFGMVSSEVKLLQEFLKDQGYYKGIITTNYFGPITQEALINFQLSANIIESREDIGAGRVGPKTIEIINQIS